MARFILLIPAFLYSCFSFACGCSPLPHTQLTMQEFNSYDVVMKAIVLEREGSELTYSNVDADVEYSGYYMQEMPKEPTYLKLKITKKIKGKVDRNASLIMDVPEHSGYFCSYNKIEIGKTYYFFANRKDGKLITTYTSRVITPQKVLPSELDLIRTEKQLEKAKGEDIRYKNLSRNVEYFKTKVKEDKALVKWNIAFLSNTLSNRTSIWYNKENVVEAKGVLTNGLPYGEWEYYAGGKIQEKGNYKKYKRHGLWTIFYDTGEKLTITNYKQGKKEGLKTSFYKGGLIGSNVKYHSNSKEGIENSYFNDGTLSASTPYHEGKYHGVKTRYSKKGQLISSASYKEGQLNGSFNEYYLDGSPRTITNYDNGKAVGEGADYFPSGKLKRKFEYSKEGTYTGDWIYYNADGTIRAHEVFDTEGNLVSSK